MPPLHPAQARIKDDPARFRVLACGRRWGKTRLGALLCFATAVEGGHAWWVGPSYKTAKIGWRLIRALAVQVKGAKIRDGELWIDFPGGGWVAVRSADNPDSLRGEGLDFLVVDECALIAEAAWTEALRPTLSDRLGRALFISTPKGQNWFWRLWLKGQGDEPQYKSWSFPTITNPYFPPGEADLAKAELPERVYAQEYEATFLEEAGGVFRNVTACVDKGRTENELPRSGRRYTLGVDLARVEDFTVLSVMDETGRQVYHERFNQISWERQTAAIDRTARLYKANIVLDSTGVGDPIFESVRKAGLNVTAFHFTNQSKEALIDNLAMRLEASTVRLMDIPAQTNELLAYQYEMTAARNVRMNAPSGMHDDCVIGLALSAQAARTPGPALVGGQRPVIASVR